MAKLKTGSMITLELFPGKALVAGDRRAVNAFLRLAFRHGFSVTDADGETSIQWQSAEKGAYMGFHRKPKTEVRPASMAFTVIFDTHYSTSTRWRLVFADRSGGYRTLKETGDPSDPFYVAKGPIWFATRDEGMAEADRRNRDELHLSARDSASIVIASMARQLAATGRGN